MWSTLIAVASVLLVPNPGEKTVLTESSVIMTNSRLCMEYDGLEQIMQLIENEMVITPDVDASYGCAKVADGVVVALRKKVGSFELDGTVYWLLEANIFNSDLTVYLSIPASMFLDPKTSL